MTYDGIDLGGERVAKETEEELARLEKAGRKVTKLSFVGYSLGGLIARYCIGLLYSRGWFDRLKPVNFTAFASPFLGVRTPYRGYHSSFWNAFGGRTLSASGQQLFIMDTFRDTGRPLLSILTEPNSIFIKALSLFKNRALYANIINDRSAPFFTTAISATDPYEDLSLVDLHPLKEYSPTILDPNTPVTIKPAEQVSGLTRFLSSSSSVVSNLPIIALVSVLAPIGTVAFLANSGYQTIQSTRRMKLHNEDSTLGFSAYRTPLLLEAAIKDVNSNLPSQKINDDDVTEKSAVSALTTEASEEQILAAEKVKKSDPADEKKPFPTLALAPEQFEMIKNLNDLGWKKYGVHITKVRHSHAAIVFRIDAERYSEGKVVIKHWINEEFEV